MEVDILSTGGGLLLRNASQRSRLDENERTPYRNSSHAACAFEVLQSSREDEVLCDIKLETVDGTTVCGHKVVLASSSPYFHVIFTSFQESNNNHVIIKELDSTALKLLVDFIYTSQIIVTEENVQVLLPAVDFLQLHDVQNACCEFLQTQLHPTNCLGIKAFADLYGCMELSSSSESYIQHHFSEVSQGDEFLVLSFEQVVKLISSDELAVPNEEKVFECVICWVNHESGCRKDLLPKLMEHVGLPLTSKEYLLKSVIEEPLLRNNFECKDYINEALRFHLLKSEQPGTIPKTIRTKPRRPVGLPKVILVVCELTPTPFPNLQWYDSVTDRWQVGLAMSTRRFGFSLAVVNDCRVYAVGGNYNSAVDMLDLSLPSPCWVPTVPMLTRRNDLGVAVLDNCIYAVGGIYYNQLNNAEVFDCSTQKWRMISYMSTKRCSVGVGLLNNLLYAVGGIDSDWQYLKSVECYHPSTDTWTPVAEMCVGRAGAGIGILDGVMYAVGGYDEDGNHKNVEAYRPSAGIWTSIADMHMFRRHVDGLLYVLGGDCKNSVEIYNPKTDTWTMLASSLNLDGECYNKAVVIDKPSHLYCYNL